MTAPPLLRDSRCPGCVQLPAVVARHRRNAGPRRTKTWTQPGRTHSRRATLTLGLLATPSTSKLPSARLSRSRSPVRAASRSCVLGSAGSKATRSTGLTPNRFASAKRTGTDGYPLPASICDRWDLLKSQSQAASSCVTPASTRSARMRAPRRRASRAGPERLGTT